MKIDEKLFTNRSLTRADLLSYIKQRGPKDSYGSIQAMLRRDFNDFISHYSNQDIPLVIDLGTFNRRFYSNSINIDMFDEGDTDLVADITLKLPIESNVADFISCTAVLEHVTEPKAVVAEIYRLLKPGGYVWVDIPFLQPFHSSPDDFQRYTLHGIEYLFKDFDKISSGSIGSQGFTIKWILDEFKTVMLNNKKIGNRKYKEIEKLLDAKNLEKLSKDLSQLDVDDVEQYLKSGFPLDYHITATGTYIFAKKK